MAVNYIFIPIIFWDVRPCTSLDNCDITAAVFKVKLKNTICVMWMRESVRGCELNSGNELPIKASFC